MDILIDFLTRNNINFSETTIEKFQTYYNLLIEYNNKFNLTAITDIDDVQIKHFIDSLIAIDCMRAGDKVIDIGSGAGFPSIPLAILLPDTQFTLVDSLNKRVGFLNTVIDTLSLKNVSALHSRAEDLDKSILYDVVVARAVAPLNILLEYTTPFIKIGGHALIYKGANYLEELNISANAISILQLKMHNTTINNLFNTDIQRVLLDFIKIAKTPPLYPRGQNMPRKSPL